MLEASNFFQALYGSKTDEDGEPWEIAYSHEFSYILRDFQDHIDFAIKFHFYPKLNDFTYFLLYLEWYHIGNVEDRHLSREFRDFAADVYWKVIDYITEGVKADQ